MCETTNIIPPLCRRLNIDKLDMGERMKREGGNETESNLTFFRRWPGIPFMTIDLPTRTVRERLIERWQGFTIFVLGFLILEYGEEEEEE